VLDRNGSPTLSSPPASNRPPGMGALYVSPDSGLNNGVLTQACGLATTVAGLACGDFSVNTQQPAFQPSGLFGAKLPAQTNATIGDRLNRKHVDWAWYSGGWSNANGDVGGPGWTNGNGPVTVGTNTHGCPDPKASGAATWPNCPDLLFQFHHQPFNYFANYAPGTSARTAHLRDESEFRGLADSSAKTCALRSVSFVKPIGAENEHPGYTGETQGSDHLVALLKAIESSRCRKDTMVVVTYDEFGGSWDHVPPPGQAGTPGPHDRWGPGTRIPALILAPHLRGNAVVDHTQHDTTSILTTIEHRFGLAALGSRDGQVPDLFSVYASQQNDRATREQH
jgi:acid phosphatase